MTDPEQTKDTGGETITGPDGAPFVDDTTPDVPVQPDKGGASKTPEELQQEAGER